MARKKKVEFPISVKVGNVSVSIGKVTKSDGVVYYQIRYRDLKGRRKTISRSDLGKAKAEAQRIAVEINNGSAQAAPLSVSDRVAFDRASHVAREIGLPLDGILLDYQRATQQLPEGSSLVEAVAFFKRHSGESVRQANIEDVVKDWLAQLRADNRSTRYIDDIKHRSDRLLREFSGSINDIQTRELQKWLNDLELSPKSKNNFRRMMVTLFRFARDQGNLAPDIRTAADRLKKVKDVGSEVGILTPDQMKLLLEKANDRLRLYLAIGGFAGLRSSELIELDWREVDLEQDHIEVVAGKAKTAQRRIVPILLNLKPWIEKAAEDKGPLFPNPEVLTDRRTLVKELKIEWPNNALRHSFASYRLALTKDSVTLAADMGNSPQIIQQNYRSVVTPAQAEKWFGLIPN